MVYDYGKINVFIKTELELVRIPAVMPLVKTAVGTK